MKRLISVLMTAVMLTGFFSVAIFAQEGSVFIDMNFDSMEEFWKYFYGSDFTIEDGMLIGNKDHKLIMSYPDEYGDPYYVNYSTWVTYDTEMTLSIDDDETVRDADRSFSLSYINDNPLYEGLADSRIFFNFNYSVADGEFSFTAGDAGTTTDLSHLMPAVAKEVCTDGSEFFKLGMSVSKDRIRCYFNDELIFDYTDTSLLIAHKIESPFLFWNVNNSFKVDNITVTSNGYLYPPEGEEDTEVSVTTELTDDTETTLPDESDDTDTTVTETETEITDDTTSATTADDTSAGDTDDTTVTETDETDPIDTTGSQDSSAATGDATFVVVIAMVAALGSALIVKKVHG